MLRSSQETLKRFDEWAASYDASASAPGGPLEGYHASLAEAARLVPVQPGWHVLDVGIGTGAFSALLAQRGGEIFGVDISAKMLEKCAAAHPEFRLRNGSFLPIPCPDGAFHAVVASFAFHEVHPSERAAACRELARVVKPGGYVCLLDIIFASAGARAEARRALGDTWDESEEYPLVWELDTQLREAGFAKITWRHTAPYHWAVLGHLPRRNADG
ncbi:MAG TPA: class I SAM-dependent methyltransferase [Symbiobacteriaceae bacterium]|nr:class I SAM-dependent methyltransferase [Symbiobacteriaceae bacterium]